jgi:hypothetical protein
MPVSKPLVIEPGHNARLRLELAGGEVVHLDIRVAEDRGVEIAVSPPTQTAQLSEESPPNPFDDPHFGERLIAHMHRAKRKAIAEAREAGLHVGS